ncbi:MAG: lysylphosphatidylglycerol synthase transmembrane domain-containing protein [Bacillota bacterium]|nr:lysylphosphatidylglycerol synthase transmembrane domain-containing protein [Bacillota bacterium]
MKEKLKKRISGKLFFNFFVVALSVGMITYFCCAPNGGLIDILLIRRSQISLWWLSGAVFFQLFNMVIDAFVTKEFISQKYPHYSFIEAVKVVMIGTFFSHTTPGASGGQPMQIYYLSKRSVDVGFASSAFIQKFLVYQICGTLYGIFAIIVKYDVFRTLLNDGNFKFYILFLVVGFGLQFLTTACVLLVSFNTTLTHKIMNAIIRFIDRFRIFRRFHGKAETINEQLDIFHDSNVALYKNPLLVAKSYFCIIIQLGCILIIPYFVYRSLGLSSASPLDIICAQSFVNLSSSTVPLPGAAGAAELGFSAFFNQYFGGTLITAILLWRLITYYGTIAITAPFSYLSKDREKEIKNIERS